MHIFDIYNKYNIMPSLQTHMLRVAGVASFICENFNEKELINTNNIIFACLLHDMGNIIKFDLSLFPHFVKSEGFDYWKNVQDEFINKYGTDEHIATYMIVKELGVSKQILKLVQSIGFSNSKNNYYTDDFNCKICAYSDFRVTPYGVDTLENRLKDGKIRFIKNKMKTYNPKLDKFDEFVIYIKKMENQIFKKTVISPDFITVNKIKPLISNLSKFGI